MRVPAPFTHEALRKRAIKWLTNRGCGVVLSEIVALGSEIPDAIGWKYGSQSHLIECKVSRSDFFANADKCHVRADTGVGQYRYFLTPPGLLRLDELPDGWGLLEAEDNRVRVRKDPVLREPNREHETVMLVSALRRIRQREFIILVPDAQADLTADNQEETELCPRK